VPAFQVARYHASLVDDKLAVTGEGKPLVNVNYHDARQLCADAGYALITETQALSLAWNLSQNARNWISGTIGEGDMYQGLHLDIDDFDEALDFSFRSTDPSERREFYLSISKEPIIDAAGNVYTWIFDDVQGDEQGVVARAFAADSPSITTAPYPSMKKGMGWQPDAGDDWSGYALLRGGCWGSVGVAGVFCLGGDSPGSGGYRVGVRCTKPVGL
jgi:formylglycine-generating enzyme required for sulfatase activity